MHDLAQIMKDLSVLVIDQVRGQSRLSFSKLSPFVKKFGHLLLQYQPYLQVLHLCRCIAAFLGCMAPSRPLKVFLGHVALRVANCDKPPIVDKVFPVTLSAPDFVTMASVRKTSNGNPCRASQLE